MPISRDDLIRCLHSLGWEGPFSGGRHGIMVRGTARLAVPNPHAGDIDDGLLSRILKQAGISRAAFNRVRRSS